jgi:hypothetical protein
MEEVEQIKVKYTHSGHTLSVNINLNINNKNQDCKIGTVLGGREESEGRR